MRIILSMLIGCLGFVFAQSTATIMTYNILDYTGGRTQAFDTVIDEIEPDLLVTQEMGSQAGVNAFLNILNDNGTPYAAAPYFDGPDKDMALFYRTAVFDLVSVTRHSTTLRDIYQYRVQHIVSGDTLIVFSVHLKASDGETERQRRLQEVMVLRNVTDNLPTTANFMIVGDYNIYYSDEPAFQELIKTSRGSGYVKDPINRLGNWHNNASFADIFTQSTRVNGGSGSGGGVDDRFDMMLLCENLLSPGGIDYVSNSYTAYGNDGLHFNQAINNGQNGVVDTDVANALHDASDHMPVLLRLRFGVPTGIPNGSENLPDTPQLFDNYPNPFNPGTNIRFTLPSAQDIQLNIYNARGQQVRSLANGNYLPGNHNLFWDATNDNGERVASGVYFYQLRAGVFQQSQKMLLIQ